MRSVDAITSGLELAGLVALAVALGLFVAQFSIPGGIAAFGAGLLAASGLVSLARGRKPVAK